MQCIPQYSREKKKMSNNTAIISINYTTVGVSPAFGRTEAGRDKIA
jgi:hypothetical protein